MHDDVAMAVGDTFGVAGRAGRVERSGLGTLVEVGEVEVGRSLVHQRLVLAGQRQGMGRNRLTVGDDDHASQRLQFRLDLLQHGDEVGMYEDDFGLRVDQRIEDLLR